MNQNLAPIPKVLGKINSIVEETTYPVEDRKMIYGEYRGEMFSAIMELDPGYADRLGQVVAKKPENAPK